MLRAAILFSLVLAISGQTTNVNQCTISSAQLPINAYIEGCINPPCQLPQLQDVVIDIIFRVPRTTTSMRTLAVAVVPPIPIPVPYPLGAQGLTCNFLKNSFCPVMEGEVLQYTLKMFIEASFPVGTQATIEFRVQDDFNNNVFCIRVPIHIIPAVDASRSGNLTISAQ